MRAEQAPPLHGSISARVGATIGVEAVEEKSMFQFTPRVGGATRTGGKSASWIMFQFTPLRGGRLHNIRADIKIKGFQFTPPRGGRPKKPTMRRKLRSFNSRPRVGGDLTSVMSPLFNGCFNSRPRVGGDSNPGKVAIGFWVSIHAPAWGATDNPDFLINQRGEFQFTPPRGGRQAYHALGGNDIAFQFTPPRGGRLGNPL